MATPYAGRRDWPQLLPALRLGARLDALRTWLLQRLREDRLPQRAAELPDAELTLARIGGESAASGARASRSPTSRARTTRAAPTSTGPTSCGARWRQTGCSTCWSTGGCRDDVALAVCAALSIATKDQAYSLYALSVPLYLLLGRASWPAGSAHGLAPISIHGSTGQRAWILVRRRPAGAGHAPLVPGPDCVQSRGYADARAP